MNTTYAIVDTTTNQIVNVILWDNSSPWNAGSGLVLVPLSQEAKCGIGWIYDLNNGTFSNPNPPSNLEDAKTVKINEIDAKTRDILAAGFVYNGVTLGLSETDRTNYLGLVIVKDALSYPYVIKGKANSDYCTITSSQDMFNMFITGVGYIDTTLRSGFTHKDAVLALTEVEDVNNYVDPR